MASSMSSTVPMPTAKRSCKVCPWYGPLPLCSLHTNFKGNAWKYLLEFHMLWENTRQMEIERRVRCTSTLRGLLPKIHRGSGFLITRGWYSVFLQSYPTVKEASTGLKTLEGAQALLTCFSENGFPDALSHGLVLSVAGFYILALTDFPLPDLRRNQKMMFVCMLFHISFMSRAGMRFVTMGISVTMPDRQDRTTPDHRITTRPQRRLNEGDISRHFLQQYRRQEHGNGRSTSLICSSIYNWRLQR